MSDVASTFESGKAGSGWTVSGAFSLARLSRVRHDLRCPLGEILGFAEVLIEEAEELKLDELIPELRRIEQAAGRVVAEVNHRLSPGVALDRDRDVGALEETVVREVGDIIEVAARLSARCDDLGQSEFGDDLLRITGSARRLRENAPQLLAEVLASPSEASPATPGGGMTGGVELGGITEAVGARQEGLVLVVDDEEANRSLLARRLRREGYTVSLAETGLQALEKLRNRKYDLVLLDILMPEMDGMEVLHRLRSDPALQNIPVLMLSAVDEMEAVVRCVELGADDYLPKPFPPQLLRARVRASLANKRMSDQLRRYTAWLFGKTLFSQAVAAPGNLRLHSQTRTVLFADIRGFTEWSERHSPEEVVELLNEYFESSEKLAAAATVIKTEHRGDEIMAVFAAPGEAVRLAVELVETVDARLRARGLSLGIGLHCGPVIEGLMGGQEVKAYCFVGDTVNTGRRVCDHARGGEVLASQAVFENAQEGFCWDESFVVKVKGKRDALHVARLRARG